MDTITLEEIRNFAKDEKTTYEQQFHAMDDLARSNHNARLLGPYEVYEMIRPDGRLVYGLQHKITKKSFKIIL